MARKSRKESAKAVVQEAVSTCRAALYVRLSVEGSRTHSASIETQQMIITQFLERNPDIQVYDTYIDNGTSGTTFHRPAFQKMLPLLLSDQQQNRKRALPRCPDSGRCSFGFPSRTHGIWCDSTIVRYLVDEHYTGTYIIGKRAVLEVGGNNSRFKDRSRWYIIPDHHPAIVDKVLFDKGQETVRRFSQPHKKQRDYLLKGIVFCGSCDHALSYVANKRPYFDCRRSQAAENGPCHDLKVDDEELEQVIFQTIKAQLEAVLSIREDGSISLDTVVAERTEYEKQIEALADSKQSLFERYIMGEMDAETYKSEKASYDAAILKSKNAYAAIAAQAKKKKEEQNRQSSRTEIAKAITDAESLTSELVNLLVEKVYVFPDKCIEIMYKVQDLFG